jgi:hypothetical protein
MPTRLAISLVVLLAALAAASSAHALTIGIADQKPDMFTDPRFLAGDLQFARRAIPWDALTSPTQTAEIDAWLAGARAAHVNPLLSFTHSSADRRSLPTPERLLYEFRRFRERYPWVTDYATWNEANHCGEPTCHRPELVAAYWRKLRRACPTCRILAAEVLDMPNMTSWVKAFRRKAKVEPRYWGIHNYIDANRLRTTGTRRLLKAVRGQVWFTETGGIVHFPHRPFNPRRAASATKFMFRLARRSHRITRVYIYQWTGARRSARFDAGLVDPHGRPRPAFWVVKAHLAPKTR